MELQRWQKIAAVLLAAVTIAAGGFLAGLAAGERELPQIDLSGDAGSQLIDDAFEKISGSAVEAPSEEELARGAVKGMVEVLRKSNDPYALFYSPESFEEFQELTTGSFSGIGVWLKQKDQDFEIISVLPSSPALEAGLEQGDVIRSVDGESVEAMTVDEAVARIKGPEGTEVEIGVERSGETLSFTIVRRAIDIPNVQASVTEGNLGYVRLLGFARGAGDQVRDEIERLTEAGAEGLVLDMRDNGGGLFTEAVRVASSFIEDGEIVKYRERSKKDVVYEAKGNAFEEIPLVVLVNEGTASAAEIVAGALQDTDRAIVVGATTFGKGSVQEVIPLLDASAVKLTTAAYLTPEGRNINGRGIKPDVRVDAAPIVQRQRAVEILRGIVLSVNESRG
jgi:carboxyl-terminal processing protease